MSLSPTTDSSPEEILQYDAGWAALNKLIRAGHSFSGKERNCAFLNLGNGTYANVSSVTGLNLIDDGRGIAHCDWDWDGKPDIWTSNRTGPRIHFLHNQIESSNNFLAVYLKGTKSNRDAIGARVEIITGKDHPPIIKTLQGGSGFLSQSSKWLHFGIGKAESIKSLQVNWPGGNPEIFSGLKANNFYIITQGIPTPEAFTPPASPAPLTDLHEVKIEPRKTARVVLLNPAPIPEIKYINPRGQTVSLDEHKGQSLLIHLWTTWCANCREEMLQWRNDQEIFSTPEITVISLCADEPTDDEGKDHARIQAAARALNFPFPVGRIKGNALETLNVLQKSFIGKQTDLPLPSSLLIDAKGNLAVIYKGPVSAAQIAEDAKLLGAQPEKILAGATPFSGKWLTPPRGGPPRGIATRMVEYGLQDAAGDYLERIIPLLQTPDPDPEAEQLRVRELAQCHVFLGAIASDKTDHGKAISHYRKALLLSPGNHDARNDLIFSLSQENRKKEALAETEILIKKQPSHDHLVKACRLLRELGRNPEAIRLYGEALAIRNSAEANFELANLLNDSGNSTGAIRHYRASLTLKPDWVLPANNLAWLLSTSKQAGLRDGSEALRLAKRVCDTTDNKVAHFLGTLAAANAEIGDFEEARTALESAVLLARAKNNTELEAKFIANLELLKKRMPIRNP